MAGSGWVWVAGWLAGWLVAAGWLRGWLGGYGSLANRGWLKPRPTNLLMSRMIPAVASIAELKVHQKWSRRHAGRPAGRAMAANRGGLTVKEKRRKQQGFRNSKKMRVRIIPRIIPESYPIHASNFPNLNLGTFARSRLVFCEHILFSSQPLASVCLLLFPRKIRRQHLAAEIAACNGTNMTAPKRAHHFNRLVVKHLAAVP